MDALNKAITMIGESNNIVAFTGAGVSTESDIPDFRSSGGLYKSGSNKYNYPPEVMLSHSFFLEHTELFFDYYKNQMIYRNAKPNDCHLGLAKLETENKLKAVVTQNIDGLHHAAGSKNVFELHGSVYRNYCMKCRKAFSLEYIMNSESIIPLCDDCNGTIKPDVVLYEEVLDESVIEGAVSSIEKADVLIVAGSSLVVYPAAGFINYYKGNKLILINMTPTAYDTRAQVAIHEKAGTFMRKVMESI